MNKIEKIELEKSIKDLTVRNNELKSLILAENSLDGAKELDGEYKENLIKITEAQNKLNSSKGEQIMTISNYLNTENSIKDFFGLMKNSTNKTEFTKSWGAKLAENDLTITDTKEQLPKRLIQKVETGLGQNEIYKAFKVTSVGSLLVSQGLKSDEARVQVNGSNLVVSDSTLEVSAISPQLVYKVAKMGNRLVQLNANFDEIFTAIVDDIVKAIVNKIVELALVSGDGTNGFVSMEKETDTDKVAKISATTLVEGIEDATDFVRGTQGAKYLVVNAEQRKALLAEIRALNPNIHIKNSDEEIANEIGVDDVLLFTGSATIKPTVLVQDAYSVDASSLLRTQAFDWNSNAEVLVMQTMASGQMNKFKGGAVITVAP